MHCSFAILTDHLNFFNISSQGNQHQTLEFGLMFSIYFKLIVNIQYIDISNIWLDHLYNTDVQRCCVACLVSNNQSVWGQFSTSHSHASPLPKFGENQQTKINIVIV